MKTRRIILALLAVAVALLIGFPHSTRIARGLTVTFEGEASSAIWFPYVINDGNFNTGITVQGNATVLPENVNPEIWIYYYSPDGTCQTEYKPTGLTKATNTQWSAPVSAIYPTQGYGSLLVLTNIPDARAQGFVFDVTGTHTLANVPVITSYTISGVDENGVMVRREGFEPPDGWDTLEPGQTEIDPSLHHSTLIFPYVIEKYGYDTGFCISNSYNASGIGDRAAALYLYNSNGVLSRKIVVDMDSTNKAVSPMFVGLLSDLGYTEITTLAQRPGIDACEEYAPFVGEGWILAVTNIPYASGCSFTDYSYIHSMTGFAAQIDNNIYGVDDSGESPTFQPLRLETPPVQHTSMIVPLVLTNFGYQTTINLTTSVNPGDTFTADCYLYNTDGSLRTGMRPDETPFDGHFQITMQSIYDMPEMPLIIINSQYISVLSIQGVEDVCVNPGEFQGWMVIVVNQPGAYATVVAATSATNQFAGYYGISDPDVWDVAQDENGNYTGDILRANPVPIDGNSTSQWRLPFFSTAGGWDTAVGTIITRNRAEWPGGNLTSSYVGYTQNGESAMTYEPSAVAPPEAPGVLPASGPIDLGALDPELGFNDTTGAISFTANAPAIAGYAVHMITDGDTEVSPLARLLPLVARFEADDGVDMNDTRSIYVELSRSPNPNETVSLVIVKKKGNDVNNQAEFPDSLVQGKLSIPVSKIGIVWLGGKGPSPPKDGQNDDGKNFVIELRITTAGDPPRTQVLQTKWFRVFNTALVFANVDFDPQLIPGDQLDTGIGTYDSDPEYDVLNGFFLMGSQKAIHVWDGNKFALADPSFHWNLNVTINNGNLNQPPANPQDFGVGIVQNVLTFACGASYANRPAPQRSLTMTYLPILDGNPLTKPVFDIAPQIVPPRVCWGDFKQNLTVPLHMDDSPCILKPLVPLLDPLDKTKTRRLCFAQYTVEFRTWLVVAFVKEDALGNRDVDYGAAKRMCYCDWHINYLATPRWNNNNTAIEGVDWPPNMSPPSITVFPNKNVQMGNTPRMVSCGPVGTDPRALKLVP